MKMLARLTAVGFAASALSCVASELRQVNETREEYEACVAEHSEAHDRCQSLKHAHEVATRRYQENARRAWGCRADDEQCPIPR